MKDRSPTSKRLAESGIALSKAEIRRRLAMLSPTDCWRLEQSARIYSEGTGWTATDLLQESFLAALDRRQWRADLDVQTFLVGVMRSLAFSRRKSQRVDALDAALLEGADATTEAFDRLPNENERGPEAHARTGNDGQDLLRRLEAIFSGDAQVLRVVQGRAAEEEPSSIRRALGVSESQYETICRRMLRRYQKSTRAKRNE